MGMVYKAHDRMLDETVAIKVLRARVRQHHRDAAALQHEIKLARKVSHRNVCRIHEYGEDGGLRYISMEFLDGTDLEAALRPAGRLSRPRGLRRHDPGGGGPAGHPRRGHHPPRPEDPQPHARRARGSCGSWTSASPRARGDGHGRPHRHRRGDGHARVHEPRAGRGREDRRALRHLLAGRRGLRDLHRPGALPRRHPVATIFKHIQDPVPFEAERRRSSSRPAPAGAAPALAKDRDQRYATAAEVAVALRQARDASAGLCRRPPPPPPGSRSAACRRRSGAPPAASRSSST